MVYLWMMLGCVMLIGSTTFAAVHNFRSRRQKTRAAGFAVMGIAFSCVLLSPVYELVHGHAPGERKCGRPRPARRP